MTKKALLIGINDYAPTGPGGPDLRGCVNDVRDMANTLSVLGIVPASPRTTRILTDARATRSAILTGFKWLISGAKKGDVLIFYYSGHGSQMADVSGEEPDGRDETICPHDFATAGMIKDDDFRASLAALPAGVNLDIILDSCHSGSATRDLAEFATVCLEESVAYRYIEPPLDWGFFLDTDPKLHVRRVLKPESPATTMDAVVVPRLNHILWAGCRDNQTSAEDLIGGIYRGIFTYNFCKILRGAGVAITRRRLDSQVTLDVRGMGYNQIPQMEGTIASFAEKVFT
jgi:hypothetical protein